MKSRPWAAGGYWTEENATVLGETPKKRISIRTESGKRVAVKWISIRLARKE